MSHPLIFSIVISLNNVVDETCDLNAANGVKLEGRHEEDEQLPRALSRSILLQIHLHLFYPDNLSVLMIELISV